MISILSHVACTLSTGKYVLRHIKPNPLTRFIRIFMYWCFNPIKAGGSESMYSLGGGVWHHHP